MKRHQILALGTAVLFGLGTQAVWADATSSPGKAAAYTSVSGVAFPLSGSPIQATVQILKGKKKRVLEVDITAVDPSSSAGAIGITAAVNGMGILEPTTFLQVEHECSPSYNNCTAHASYWLDIDTAEGLFPGQFVNVPLDVSVTVFAGGTATTGNVSVRARLVKK